MPIATEYEQRTRARDFEAEQDFESVTPPSLGAGLHSIISEMGGIASDLLNLAALRLEMARAEIQESKRTYQRSVIMLSIGACLAVLALGAVTVGLVALIAAVLPLPAFAAFGVGALIVALIYAGVAWFASKSALRLMRRTSLTPRTSIAELKHDFETLGALKRK